MPPYRNTSKRETHTYEGVRHTLCTRGCPRQQSSADGVQFNQLATRFACVFLMHGCHSYTRYAERLNPNHISSHAASLGPTNTQELIAQGIKIPVASLEQIRDRRPGRGKEKITSLSPPPVHLHRGRGPSRLGEGLSWSPIPAI